MSDCKDCNGTGHIVTEIYATRREGDRSIDGWITFVKHCEKCGGCGKYGYGDKK
jgi:hypothetical protein